MTAYLLGLAKLRGKVKILLNIDQVLSSQELQRITDLISENGICEGCYENNNDRNENCRGRRHKSCWQSPLGASAIMNLNRVAGWVII